MKKKTLNTITSIIGYGFLLFAGYMMYEKYDMAYVAFDIFISLGLIFYQSQLYNKLSGRMK